MTIHSPAARAAHAVTRAKWGRGKARRKHFDPTPISRTPSNGVMGPLIKVLDANTRTLIDDAMRRRIESTSEHS